MTLITRQQEVRLLAEHPLDATGRRVLDRASAVAIIREHLELEEVEAFDTDDDIWRLWQEETEAASPDDINAGVLERVLERIRTGD
jgi:hypothetical protein